MLRVYSRRASVSPLGGRLGRPPNRGGRAARTSAWSPGSGGRARSYARWIPGVGVSWGGRPPPPPLGPRGGPARITAGGAKLLGVDPADWLSGIARQEIGVEFGDQAGGEDLGGVDGGDGD